MLLPTRSPSAIYWLAVFAMFIVRLPIAASQQRPGCRPGTYLEASSGNCLPCAEGVTFLDEEYNTQPRCLDCSPCRGIMIPAVACSAASDTVCRCPNGFMITIEGLCRPVNSGGHDGKSPTDSSGRTASALTTDPASEHHPSTAAKPSGLEAMVLRSIDAKLDQLIYHDISVLALMLLVATTVWTYIVIKTCCRCKKSHGVVNQIPRQPVENPHSMAAADRVSAAPATDGEEEKVKNKEEQQVLIPKIGVDTLDGSSDVSGTALHRRFSRTTSALQEVKVADEVKRVTSSNDA